LNSTKSSPFSLKSSIVALNNNSNAQLKALELLFDPDWIPLKQLNASFEFNGKKVVVMLHEAKLNKIDLKAISTTTPSMFK
jgi:uncharacterized protein YhdP